jgi:hypothetical protein
VVEWCFAVRGMYKPLLPVISRLRVNGLHTVLGLPMGCMDSKRFARQPPGHEVRAREC